MSEQAPHAATAAKVVPLPLPEPAGARPRRPLRAIQGSRFTIGAALFVVHVLAFAQLDGLTLPPWSDVLVNAGRAGVAFFFALSGFLLTIAYGPRLAAGGRPARMRFWGARVASIWPVHLAGLALMLPIYLPGLLREPLAWGATLLAHAAMLQAFIPGSVEGVAVTLALNTPAWSLSALVLFYGLFPFLMRAGFARFGERPHGWLASAGVLWLVVLGAGWVAGESAAMKWTFHYFPPLRFVDFLGGIALGVLWLNRRHLRWPLGRIGSTLLELAVLALWVLTAWTAELVPDAVRYDSWNIPVVLAAIWLLARGGGAVSWLLASGPMQRAGDLTLAFAMLHFPITYVATLLDMYVRLGLLASTVLLFAISLAVAVAGMRYLELPARTWIRSAIDERYPDAPAEAADAGTPVVPRAA